MIEFRHVRKSFDGREVLSDVTFTVNEAEIVFVLGRSGTGKSVLLKSIVGLNRIDDGHIVVDGIDVTRLDEAAFSDVRRNCGMVFQHPALFDSSSVFDNVAYGLRRHFLEWSEERVRQRVEDCLEWVNLPRTIERDVASLSYGMQKRVSLARTLALLPKTLLFDEPTTGLDPITTTAINELICQLSRRLKTTSIVVSHDMRCALAIADRILILDEGRIVADGSPADLRASTLPLAIDFLKEARVVEEI